MLLLLPLAVVSKLKVDGLKIRRLVNENQGHQTDSMCEGEREREREEASAEFPFLPFAAGGKYSLNEAECSPALNSALAYPTSAYLPACWPTSERRVRV